jgi:hypothetical protein
MSTVFLRSMALGLAIAAPWTAVAVDIGAVGAVNPRTTGEPPATSARQLVVTDRVVLEERIVAGENGLAQLMLLDQTTLTVGPNSEVVLDRFVYDPDADAGEVALTLTRGAMRFIGGRISKSSDATIRTPGGLIGLRGGMMAIDATDARTRIVLLAGERAVVTVAGQTLTLSRPGAVALIADPRGPSPALSFGGVLGADEAGELFAGFASPGNGGDRGLGPPQIVRAAFAPGAPQAPDISTLGEVSRSAAPQSELVAGTQIRIETQSALFSDPAVVRPENIGFADVGTSGELRGQLLWRDASDLDLRLRLPVGAVGPLESREVFVGNPIVPLVGGGVARLDVDNLGDAVAIAPDIRVENIAVTGGPAPPGRYVFFVRAATLSPQGSPYTLTVTPDGGRQLLSAQGRLTPAAGGQPGVIVSDDLLVDVAPRP